MRQCLRSCMLQQPVQSGRLQNTSVLIFSARGRPCSSSLHCFMGKKVGFCWESFLSTNFFFLCLPLIPGLLLRSGTLDTIDLFPCVCGCFFFKTLLSQNHVADHIPQLLHPPFPHGIHRLCLMLMEAFQILRPHRTECFSAVHKEGKEHLRAWRSFSRNVEKSLCAGRKFPVCLELVAIHQNQLQEHSRAEVTACLVPQADRAETLFP